MKPTQVSRPHMPGYGTLGPAEGTGLLPWSWAEQRLAGSHDYWLATLGPPDHPHLMPVWAVLMDGRLWFSSAAGSRKARNLRENPWCSLATDDAEAPVVAEGSAKLVTDLATLERVLVAENEKYATSYGMDMLDPSQSHCFALKPARVFGLATSDFVGSPTRWSFE